MVDRLLKGCQSFIEILILQISDAVCEVIVV